jgi:hypothetical protein
LRRSLKRASSDSKEMTETINLYHAFIIELANRHHIDSTIIFNKSELSRVTRSAVKSKRFPEIDSWRGELLTEESKLFFQGEREE